MSDWHPFAERGEAILDSLLDDELAIDHISPLEVPLQTPEYNQQNPPRSTSAPPEPWKWNSPNDLTLFSGDSSTNKNWHPFTNLNTNSNTEELSFSETLPQTLPESSISLGNYQLSPSSQTHQAASQTFQQNPPSVQFVTNEVKSLNISLPFQYDSVQNFSPAHSALHQSQQTQQPPQQQQSHQMFYPYSQPYPIPVEPESDYYPQSSPFQQQSLPNSQWSTYPHPGTPSLPAPTPAPVQSSNTPIYQQLPLRRFQSTPLLSSDHPSFQKISSSKRSEFANLRRSDSQKRDNWLEEFRQNRGNSHLSLRHASERHIIRQLAADQFGSRFIQQKLETASLEEKEMAFSQLKPDILNLCQDVFGNYVVQKFLEFGTPQHRSIIINSLTGHVLALSLQMYGCRVVQKAIDLATSEQQTQIIQELHHNVMDCVRDQNGNHVIQKCIERVHSSLIQFIVEAFSKEINGLSTHPYGCRVIQRLLEHCSPEQQDAILKEILLHTQELCQNQYGNYVIQHVLVHGHQRHRAAVLETLKGHLVELSKHKFASNVIEKCFGHASKEDRNRLLAEVFGEDDDAAPLISMVKDQYANYVVQTMIDVVDEEQRVLLINHLRNHVHTLRKIPYGKHIITRIERMMG